jgi:hypothetical protein
LSDKRSTDLSLVIFSGKYTRTITFEIFFFCVRCLDNYGGFLRPDLCVVGPTNYPGQSPAASGTNSGKSHLQLTSKEVIIYYGNYYLQLLKSPICNYLLM